MDPQRQLLLLAFTRALEFQTLASHLHNNHLIHLAISSTLFFFSLVFILLKTQKTITFCPLFLLLPHLYPFTLTTGNSLF